VFSFVFASEEGAFVRASGLVKDLLTDRRAMMEQAQSKSGLTEREFDRTLGTANALLHCRGSFQTVRVVDYAQSGLQLAGTFGLFEHDAVQVELTSGLSLPGRVAWSVGNRSGVAFSEPMDVDHPAFLELAQKTGKALGDADLQIANKIQRAQLGHLRAVSTA
jgi:hypothetical protein